MGNFLAEAFKGNAAQIGAELQKVADNVPQVLTIQDRRDTTQLAFLSQAADVAAFNTQVENANNIINNTGVAVGLLGGYFNELSESTFTAAKAALDFGTNQQTVVATLNQIAPLNDQFTVALQAQVDMMGMSADSANALQQELLKLAFSSEEGKVQAINLFNAFLDGRISADELRIALDNIAASNAVLLERSTEVALALQRQGERELEVAEATNAANDAINAQIESIADEITKRALANAEAEKSKAIQEELNRLARLVADGTYEVEQATGILAQTFNLTTDQAALFAQALGIISSELDNAARKMTDYNLQAGAVLSTLNKFPAAQESAKRKPFAWGETFVDPRDPVKSSAGRSSPQLSQQEKLNNQLATNQDKYFDKIEKAELDHQQRLLSIQQEYAAKQLAAQRASELSKRRSRADFYGGLIEMEGIDQSAFSAAYEAAFAESQKIAQQGNKQLAQDYLELRQAQIDADIDYARKRKDIEESDLSKADKQARLQALENVNKMRQEADAEELKQLLEGGDPLQNELQTKLDEEAQKYKDQLADIGLTSTQLADLRIANWERANKVIAGMPAAELLNFQGITPTQDVNQTVAQTVQDVVTVKDIDLISSVSALGDRLAGKLDEVRSAVDSAQSAITQKLGTVESAVRNIRPKLVT